MKEASYKKPHVIWFYLSEMYKKGKSIETKSRLAVAGAGVGISGFEGKWGVTVNGVPFWGLESVLK